MDLKNFQKKTIALIGHMGSGKTSVGRELARNLNWDFFDSDKEIEKQNNISIKKIFKLYGENYFRKKEEITIRDLLRHKYSVISLGGGSVIIKNIRNLLQKKAISIFLKVDIEVLTKRLRNNKRRPLLVDTNIKNTIASLDKERLPYYTKADIVVENSKSLNITVEKILNILNK